MQKIFDAIFERVPSNKLLDSHIMSNIVFDPENRILAKNSKFGGTFTSRLAILWYPLKTTKIDRKSSKMPFLPFWWPDIMKIAANHVWNTFWDISGQKVLIKKKFPFLHRKTMIFQKNFGNAQNPLFWAQKPGWMCFPLSFNDKSMKNSRKRGSRKKCSRKV